MIRNITIRVDAPFVATVLIVAIFAITFFKSFFYHIFVLILGNIYLNL